tara:strand:- start:7868 stop:8299 length:432 start_codon:yes stop_codon:yes gene_type:complete
MIATYWIYCEIYWKNYHNEKWDNDYDFHSLTIIPLDSALTRSNYQNFTWTREIIEPEHGQWINKTTLVFVNDTTMEVNVLSGYISKNYFYYPIFKEFISTEEPFSYIYKYDYKSMSFQNRWMKDDSVQIHLNKNSITINYSFL